MSQKHGIEKKNEATVAGNHPFSIDSQKEGYHILHNRTGCACSTYHVATAVADPAKVPLEEHQLPCHHSITFVKAHPMRKKALKLVAPTVVETITLT